MNTFLGDLRFAIRSLLRTPAVPLTAIATLALGIGATTAIFSTVNAALLRPLPYPNGEDLFSLRTTLTDGRVTTGLLAPSEIFRLNQGNNSIVHAAGMVPQEATMLAADGTPTHQSVIAVSDGFFEMFGLPMTLGGFTREQYLQNGPPVVILSYQIWRDRFASDPLIVGKPMHFVEFTPTITGVAPRGFDTPHAADFWINQPLDPQGVGHNFEGFMRVKPGVPLARIESEMAATMAGLAHDFPASDNARAYVVHTLVEQVVGDLSSTLVIVLSATALLLILACVNVTNLLLARGAARSREMAVRVALGANRARIIRQLLTESMLLSTAGAVVGLGVAFAGVRVLMVIGAAKLPRLDAVPFDSHVLLFALGTLVVSGLLVGFAPALRLAGTDVKTLMNESGRSASVSRGTARWLGAMTIAEIALAVTLVAGAGWLVRGFANMRTINPGFQTNGRVVFDVSNAGPSFRDADSLNAWRHDLFGRIRSIPGVAAIGSTTNYPLRGAQENSVLTAFHGNPLDPANPMGARQRAVSPGYFEAMGISRIAGRDFTSDDKRGATPVLIVSRSFVRMYMAGKDPLREQLAFGYPNIDPRNQLQIIGVVDDVRQKSLTLAAEPAIYTTLEQFPSRRQTIVVSPARGDAAALIPAIRTEVRKLDSQMALDFLSSDEIAALTLKRQELGMTLMLLFGASAIALAAVGIYGVIAHATAERRSEIATRLALGATRGMVFRLMLQRGVTFAGAGAVIGLVTAYATGQLISNLLYQVSASDPAILGAAVALVVGIALLATTIPALRAAHTDPIRALRPE